MQRQVSCFVMFSVSRSCTVRVLIFIMFPLHFIVKHIATAGQFTAVNLLSPRLKEGTWIWQGVLCYKQDTVHETKKNIKMEKNHFASDNSQCLLCVFLFFITFLFYVIQVWYSSTVYTFVLMKRLVHELCFPLFLSLKSEILFSCERA